MTQFSDERGAELRELFFETAQEMLQAMNDNALQLEKTPGDLEIVRSIRRAVHTLKGDAAATGFRELSELAHHFEDSLALEALPAEASLAEIAFKAADVFGAMLHAYRHQTDLPSSDPLRNAIDGLLAAAKKTSPAVSRLESPNQVIWTEYERMVLQRLSQAGKAGYYVRVTIDPLCAMPIAARQLLLNAIDGFVEFVGMRPEAGSPEPAKEFHLLIATEQPPDYLASKCQIPTIISHVSVSRFQEGMPLDTSSNRNQSEEAVQRQTTVSGDSEPVLASIPSKPQNGGRQPSNEAASDNVLRVDAERIDNVLNLVGELIIGKSMLQQSLNEYARSHPKDAMRGRFSDAIAFQGRVLNDLQRAVMKIRMVPVDQLFRRFPRMVRDVARQCNKEVDLVVSGADTDLDKSLLDAIAEPLTHLVRNAISHGIEPAEMRTAKGKPARGTLRLSAYHHGNQVVIEVTDDGCGVDSGKVKARAVQKQIVTPEEAEKLTEGSVLDLLFRPGFSTADEITEIAGRGVGLDVVQSVLNRLKGTVNIETRSGKGTTFRLKLPLTLAIIKALLFRVDHRLYAVPLNAVAEISRVRESDLHRVNSREVLQLRSEVLPGVRLGKTSRTDSSTRIFVLVIGIGERKFALLVDALEGEEQLVIKALDDQTVETDLVSGASILGDGRVVLILNLPAIIERFTKSRPESAEVDLGLLLSHAERVRTNAAAAGGQS